MKKILAALIAAAFATGVAYAADAAATVAAAPHRLTRTASQLVRICIGFPFWSAPGARERTT